MLALAALLGGWVALWLVKKTVTTPISDKKQQIANLDQQIEDAQRQVDSIDRARFTLARWKSMSPPPNPNDAQRLYKEWIRDLVTIVGFDDPVIEPGSLAPKRLGRRMLYTTVPVTVKGKTTFPRLCRFLYYFHRTELMHRVADLSIESEGNEGNPKMKIKLICEALALSDAQPRSHLFPMTKLKTPLEIDNPKITVESIKGFPTKTPFQLRIGTQFLTTTDTAGNTWTVRPGVDPPPNSDVDSLESQSAGDIVQLNRMRIVKDKTLSDYRKAVYGRYANPFVLPQEYRPSLRISGNTRLRPGEDLRLKAEAGDLDPDKGKPTFALGENAPKGMTIDTKTGEIRWSVEKDAKADRHRAEVKLFQGSAKQPLLTRSFSVDVNIPNNRPRLSVSKSSHEIFAGQQVAFEAKATDPDGQRLSFSLSGAPSGADIDSRTGKFEWTPDEDADPNTYRFDVVVSDSGFPAQRDTQSVVINVKQKAERYVRLIGRVAEGPQRQVLFWDIANNKQMTVTEGSPFEIAGISGFLFVIGFDFIEFQAGGDTYRLKLGKFLSDRKKVEPKSAAKKSTTVKTSKSD